MQSKTCLSTLPIKFSFGENAGGDLFGFRTCPGALAYHIKGRCGIIRFNGKVDGFGSSQKIPWPTVWKHDPHQLLPDP